MSAGNIADWTRGQAGIAYQSCPACRAVWYFQRHFCPRCGNPEPLTHQASGNGTVHALSIVYRAPTEALRTHAPYTVVLIDADEGFRLMGHGEASLSIGDRVRAQFQHFGGSLIPCFGKIKA